MYYDDETLKLKQELARLLEEKEKRKRYNRIEDFFPDDGKYNRDHYPKHIEFMGKGKRYRQRAFVAANRTGKAQPLEAKIMTPTGFKAMGNIQVGDKVIGSQGAPTAVLGVFPQGQRPVYKITFSDKTCVEADADHLWNVRKIGNGRKATYITIHTTELLEDNYCLPDRPIVEFEEHSELSIDPYFIGLLLGDGGLSTGSIYISSKDSEIVEYCYTQALQYECQLKKCGDCTYRFSTTSKESGRFKNWLQVALDEYNLRYKDSFSKSIPEEYLITSTENRIALLQGLMDTDGYIGESGTGEYSTVSKQLASDFQFLAHSLGIAVTLSEVLNAAGNLTYRIYIPRTEIPLFRLSRKANRQVLPTAARAIKPVKLEYIGEKECQCIEVAAEDSLYLTDYCIPTHNTVTGAFEMACHLTGIYPHWWEGKRFTGPISAWAASKTAQMTRDVVQKELLGNPIDPGTGMIPQHLIKKVVRKSGSVGDSFETIYVQHISGGISDLGFKSYDQGRETFQGTKKQVIWLDEEPSDQGIFSECLTRTAGDDGDSGIIYCTFTPLLGLSDVVMAFLPDGKMPANGVAPEAPYRFVTCVTWEEVPHISEEWKEEALASFSPHEREARSKGRPALGAGAIYPYPEESVTVETFEIPIWWPRAYGMDVGWNKTACIWGAIDPETSVIYLYSEHYMGHEPPPVHASAIKQRGNWIIGAIDPKSDSRNQVDGTRLMDLYEQEGLLVTPADNSVEAGLYKVGHLFASGQLKIMKHLKNTLAEYRIYRRDENGKIIKKNDHLMDAMRYLIMSGLEYAQAVPDPDAQDDNYNAQSMGGNRVTGY